MKRTILLVLAMVVAMSPCFSKPMTEKEIKKNVKDKVKALEKGGWEVWGTTLTLDAALAEFYTKKSELGDFGYEQVGSGSESTNKTVLHQKALIDAARSYAQKAASQVVGKIISEMGSISAKDLEEFSSTFSASVSKSINGQLKEYFSIIRPSKAVPGSYEMQTYFLVDEKEAVLLRRQALKEAYLEKRFKTEVMDALDKAVDEPLTN